MSEVPAPTSNSSLPRKLDANLTVTRMVHGPFEALANRALGISEKLGFKWGELDSGPLLARARRSKKLQNWGDEQFVGGLDQILANLGAPGWTPLGRVLMRGMTRRAVEHRLEIEKWFEAHPEAEDVPIEKPVFVLGFPRTGTTLLQNLLSCAPQRRSLQFWELTNPIPTCEDLEKDRRRRIRSIAFDLFWVYRFVPELPLLHHTRPTSPEECWSLFANSLAVLNYDLCDGLTEYGDWLLSQDLSWAYREYRRQLQMLLYRLPAERLVLKCPEHLWFVDSLLEVFPDACIVQTHREPTDCIASYCSMVSLARRTMSGRIQPEALGAHTAMRFQQGVERAMAAREVAGEDRFIDVDFYDLVADPKGFVAKIEERFELKPTDPALLDDWLTTERVDSRGQHKYSAELYGLDPKEIQARFKPYIDRFGVRLTPPSK